MREMGEVIEATLTALESDSQEAVNGYNDEKGGVGERS